jgi:hypothetical protein
MHIYRRCLLTGLLIAGLVATNAFAASNCVNDAMQEAIAGIVECASYYLVVARGLKATPGQEQMEKDNEAAALRLLNLGTMLGQKEGIAHEATVARFKLLVGEMNKIVGGNTGNWPILLLKYADHCKALTDDASSYLADNLARECHVAPGDLKDPSQH